MTEEERFQAVKNIYMNYEHELAQRGMEDVAPVAASLTTAYVLHALLEGMRGDSEEQAADVMTVAKLIEEEWDTQP